MVLRKSSLLGSAWSDRLWAFTRPQIDQLFYTGGGLGDELMLTAVAAEGRRRGRPFHVLTDSPGVWKNNADPVSVQSGIEKWFRAKNRGRIKTEITHLACRNSTHVHLAVQMAQTAGLELSPNWAPVFPARRPAGVPGDSIVIQNSCRGARYAATTKEWPFERWNQLAAMLISQGHRIVQIGTQEDPPVPRAVDLRGKTDLPRAAAILEEAKLFIGLESGLMHLAAAVRVPSVIIYGGRTRPYETGYSFHRHVGVSQLPCSGCALNSGCPIEVQCMTDISVDEVWNAVKQEIEAGSREGRGERHAAKPQYEALGNGHETIEMG